jgi:hypothetical protein
MTKRNSKRIVTEYIKMWPRAVFDMKVGNKHPKSIKDLLRCSGVYVLYRDDRPYYIGKASQTLWKRIWAHANATRDRYYHFWNYFSAFVVPDPAHLDEIEGVLIASMPTENSAIRRIDRIHLPADIAQTIHRQRQIVCDE